MNVKECQAIVPVMLDVRYQDSVDACLETVKKNLQERNEELVALFNNAGIGKGMPIEFVDTDEVQDAFNVNVFGVFRLYRACIPFLRNTGTGARIVNTSSLAGLMTTQGTHGISIKVQRDLYSIWLNLPPCIN